MWFAVLLVACGDPGGGSPSAVAPPAPPPRPDGVVTGERAPPLDLARLDGPGRWQLTGLTEAAPGTGPNGALIAFMASWCGPCAASLPTLAALEREHPDLTVVTVVVDDAPAGRDAELRKVRAAGITGPVLAHDPATTAQWVGTGRSVPRFVFVGRDGGIVAQDRGFGDNVKGLMPRQVARTLAPRGP